MNQLREPLLVNHTIKSVGYVSVSRWLKSLSLHSDDNAILYRINFIKLKISLK